MSGTLATIKGAIATKDVFKAAVVAAKKLVSDKLGKTEAQKLGVRYWGVVLFEMRQNLDSVQSMIADEGHQQYAVIELRAWDALFETLCKFTPLPAQIAAVQQINVALREIQALLTTAVNAPTETVPAGSLGSFERRGGGEQWNDAHLQAVDVVRTAAPIFNAARAMIEDVARDAWGDSKWQAIAPAMLPEPLDGSDLPGS